MRASLQIPSPQPTHIIQSREIVSPANLYLNKIIVQMNSHIHTDTYTYIHMDNACTCVYVCFKTTPIFSSAYLCKANCGFCTHLLPHIRAFAPREMLNWHKFSKSFSLIKICCTSCNKIFYADIEQYAYTYTYIPYTFLYI